MTKTGPTTPLLGGSLNGSQGFEGTLQQALSKSLFGPRTEGLFGVDKIGATGVRLRVSPGGILTYAAVGQTSLPTTLRPDMAALPFTDCPPGTYLYGTVCALCPPGSFCEGGSAEALPCAPGSISSEPGVPECVPCSLMSYQDKSGQISCNWCPENSFSYVPGAHGCIACYFGEPHVVTGRIGNEVGPWPDIYTEQTKAGFRIARLSANSPLTNNDTCGFVPFTDRCTSLSNRVLAIETYPTCEVRLYVIGDAGCSDVDTMTVVEGVYADLQTVVSRPGSSAPFTVWLGLADGGEPGSTDMVLTFEHKEEGTVCSDTGVQRLVDTTCLAGTAPETNPQKGKQPLVDVFKDVQCEPCDTGASCPSGASQPCKAGTFNSIVGGSTCLPCPLGMVSDTGAEVCQPCGLGFIAATGRANCQLPPAGHFSTVPNGWQYQPCPAGTFRTAEADGTICTKCPLGSWSDQGAPACTLCKPGTATANEGTPKDPKTDSCPACPAGQFAAGNGSYSCNVCTPGTISATAGSDQCIPCGGGRYTISVNGTGASKCTLCPRGTFKPADATDNRCRSCPTGYETGLDGEGAATCTPCQRGYFASAPNTPKCSPCGPGSAASNPGSKICTLCPAGSVTGLTPTNAPPNATAAERLGFKAIAAFQCDSCPRRTFRPSMYAANMCAACPKGRETKKETGATTCNSCAPGFSLLMAGSQWSTTCSACGKGEYARIPGVAGSCTPCRPGTFAPDDGNSECEMCAPGTYSDASGATSCTSCPEGTYNDLSGSTSLDACVKAPKGSFAAGTGNDGFTACEGGYFQDQEGQAACKPCPPGSACQPGAVAPKQCQLGFSADIWQAWCKECPRGTFQDLPGGRSCKPCPLGYFCPNTKMAAPSPCAPGTFEGRFNALTPDVCTKCPANFFTATAGLTKCTKCEANMWTGRLTGQSSCWPTSQAVRTPKGKKQR